MDSDVVDMLWCGNSNEVVFLLTTKGTVYKSADQGFKWVEVHSELEKVGEKSLEGD